MSNPRRLCWRSMHATTVVWKKGAKANIDDFFSEAAEDDLFSDPVTGKDASSSTTSARAPSDAPLKRVKKLSTEARNARFSQIREFMAPRLGRSPTFKTPQVKKSAWSQLVQLASTEEQIKDIISMMPEWQEKGCKFDASFSELFVRRCQELRCPQQAVEVFGDYAKYQVPLTLPAAHQLLHSLHLHHPLSLTLTVAALYPVYHLPPVNKDLLSCTMVTAACFHHAHVHKMAPPPTDDSTPATKRPLVSPKNALKLAHDLVPQLEALLKDQPRLDVERQKKWMFWLLKRIETVFQVTGERKTLLEAWNGQLAA